MATLGKVNSRPIPEGSVLFVSTLEGMEAAAGTHELVVLLPNVCTEIELSNDALEDVEQSA